MNEGISLAGPLYAYGLLLALAAALGVWLARRTLAELSLGSDADAVSLALWVIPCALLGARAVYCLVRIQMILSDLGAGFVFQLWKGGYSLVGALLGGALGVWLYARRHRLDALRLMDACAPAAMLVLTIARLAEAATDQGVGDYVLNEALWFFPFGVPDLYGDYLMPVFFYEALAALALAVWGFVRLRRCERGQTVFATLVWLCVSQIFLESFREDDSLRFGFVRFNQLCGAAGLLGALVWRWQRGRACWKRACLFAVTVLALVGIEFALDRTEISNVLLYGIMAAMLLWTGVSLSASWKEPSARQSC